MPPDHDTAVGLIYDAVLDPVGWHAALTAVSRLTGVQTFHLCAWNAAESRDELGIVTDVQAGTPRCKPTTRTTRRPTRAWPFAPASVPEA